MGYIFAGIVIGAVVIAVILATQNKRRTTTSTAGSYSYSKRDLLSPGESIFYNALRQALSEDYLIWPKMGLWAVIRNNERGGWQKISQKHLDFVIVRKADLKALAAVELDDSSHNREAAIKRDADKNFILESAGMPLLRIVARRNYNLQELKEALAKLQIKSIESVTPSTAGAGIATIPVPPIRK